MEGTPPLMKLNQWNKKNKTLYCHPEEETVSSHQFCYVANKQQLLTNKNVSVLN